MAYTVSLSNRFKKDFRRCIKRGLNMKHITDAMDLLEATGMLPAKYRPHKLSGDKDGQWECHIEPDWLMTWELHIPHTPDTARTLTLTGFDCGDKERSTHLL